MEVSVYRNLSAIRFVRCATLIPGSRIYAGGAGFTLSEALAKCESERAERHFELHELRPAGIRPTGIAAHVNYDLARKAALNEGADPRAFHAGIDPPRSHSTDRASEPEHGCSGSSLP